MNNSIKQISIIGCGWLGWPLAKQLLAIGYTVKGSTTDSKKLLQLKSSGIDAYPISLNETGIEGPIDHFLSGSDCLIINIPPGLRKQPDKNHVKEIQLLLHYVKSSSVKALLFISSISVFKDEAHFPLIDASSRPNNSSNTAIQLLEIETLLGNLDGIKCSVLRLAGLFDEARHPGNSLSGRAELSNALAPLNLIHRSDVIQSIIQLIKLNLWGEALNLAYPYHPEKMTYYQNYCRQHQLPIPEYDLSKGSRGKLIDSSKTEQLLQFNMAHRP